MNPFSCITVIIYIKLKLSATILAPDVTSELSNLVISSAHCVNCWTNIEADKWPTPTSFSVTNEINYRDRRINSVSVSTINW